jgi:hypothetical protein
MMFQNSYGGISSFEASAQYAYQDLNTDNIHFPIFGYSENILNIIPGFSLPGKFKSFFLFRPT